MQVKKQWLELDMKQWTTSKLGKEYIKDVYCHPGYLVFPGGSDSEETTRNVGDLGSIPGLGRSLGGGRGNPLQYSCLENPYGQKSLAGYSPWGRKELDITE